MEEGDGRVGAPPKLGSAFERRRGSVSFSDRRWVMYAKVEQLAVKIARNSQGEGAERRGRVFSVAAAAAVSEESDWLRVGSLMSGCWSNCTTECNLLLSVEWQT